MDSNIYTLIYIVIMSMILIGGVAWFAIFILKDIKDDLNDVKLDMEHINEESYLRYAKFYGNTIPTDLEFNTKVNRQKTMNRNLLNFKFIFSIINFYFILFLIK